MRQPNWNPCYNQREEYERTYERTHYIRRAKDQQQHENQPNQFVIKHEASSKQRVLDKIVIWHKIVQQRSAGTTYSLSLSLRVFCFGSILCCSQSGNDPLEDLANFGYKLNTEVEFLDNLVFFFWLKAKYESRNFK
jgi:hypothetical protein